MVQLGEDDIDDILYFARTNSLSDLQQTLTELSQAQNCSQVTILENCVDVDSGNTAAHYAAANGHVGILKFLHETLTSVAHNATPTTTTALPPLLKPNNQGNTSLHWAALNGQLDAVKFLIGLGADASVTNHAGQDAVFEAEKAGREEVVTWLLTEAKGLEQGIAGGQEADTEEDVNGGADLNDTSIKDEAMEGVEKTDSG